MGPSRLVLARGTLFATGGQVLDALVAQFVRESVRRVRLDLREVSTADLPGIRALAAAQSKLRAAGASLAITSPSRSVYSAFQAYRAAPLARPSAGAGRSVVRDRPGARVGSAQARIVEPPPDEGDRDL